MFGIIQESKYEDNGDVLLISFYKDTVSVPE